MLAKGHRDRSPLRSRSIISQHLPTRSTMRPTPWPLQQRLCIEPHEPKRTLCPECLGMSVCSHNSDGAKKSNVSHSLACPGPLLTLLLLSKDARCC